MGVDFSRGASAGGGLATDFCVGGTEPLFGGGVVPVDLGGGALPADRGVFPAADAAGGTDLEPPVARAEGTDDGAGNILPFRFIPPFTRACSPETEPETEVLALEAVLALEGEEDDAEEGEGDADERAVFREEPCAARGGAAPRVAFGVGAVRDLGLRSITASPSSSSDSATHPRRGGRHVARKEKNARSE